ncbi:hypothetical protein DICPUDRAFT_4928, partial [Dictyostelium purpureum]
DTSCDNEGDDGKKNKMKTSIDMGCYINSSIVVNNNNGDEEIYEGDTDIEVSDCDQSFSTQQECDQPDEFAPTQVLDDDSYEPQQFYRSDSMSRFNGVSSNRLDENVDKNINKIFNSQSFINDSNNSVNNNNNNNNNNQINFRQLVKLKSTLKNYEIPYKELIMEKEIGKGFFGKVYKARWRGKSVAIKKITLTRFRDLSEQEIFDKELSIMSKLCHSKCVMFIGACSLDTSNKCIVMEYMEGGSLRPLLNEFLENKKQREEEDYDEEWEEESDNEEFENFQKQFLVPPPLQLSIARDIAEGMNYLHTNFSDPIIHRDLTSSNILLDSKYTAKINDFGLSKELKPGPSQMTAAMGSLAWMAPECFKAEKYSQKVDIYSYAIILWELITCRDPYNGMEPLQMAFLASVEDYRLPLDDIPQYWSQLITKCWHRDPLQRPSFSEILQFLDQIEQNQDYQNLNQIYNSYKNKLKSNRNNNSNNDKSINNNRGSGSGGVGYYAKSNNGGSNNNISYSTTDIDKDIGDDSKADKLFSLNQNRQKTFIIGSPQKSTSEPTLIPSNINNNNNNNNQNNNNNNNNNICDIIKKIKFIEENKAFLISYHDNSLIKYFNIENNQFYGSLRIEKSIVDMKYQVINNKVFLAVATSNNNSISIFDLSSVESSQVLPEDHVINPIKTFHCDPTHTINSITWNSQNIITASKDKTIKIWDVENSKALSTMDHGGVNVLSIDSQSYQPLMCSGGEDGKIKLWDLRNAHCFRTFGNQPGGSNGPITSLVIRSPHTDPVLFSGSSENSTLKVWNMYSSTCLDSFRSHSKDLLDIHNNNSINRLVAFSSDGLVSFYDNNNYHINNNHINNNNEHQSDESISFIKNMTLNNIDSNNPLQSAQLISKNTIVYSSNNKLYS